jgi:DNA-directed RNA polymerase subunit N (RpoN/RPB10)
MTADDNNISGFTCFTCGKIFQTEEEFKNRHKRKVKSELILTNEEISKDSSKNTNSIDLLSL